MGVSCFGILVNYRAWVSFNLATNKFQIPIRNHTMGFAATDITYNVIESKDGFILCKNYGDRIPKSCDHRVLRVGWRI